MFFVLIGSYYFHFTHFISMGIITSQAMISKENQINALATTFIWYTKDMVYFLYIVVPFLMLQKHRIIFTGSYIWEYSVHNFVVLVDLGSAVTKFFFLTSNTRGLFAAK